MTFENGNAANYNEFTRDISHLSKIVNELRQSYRILIGGDFNTVIIQSPNLSQSIFSNVLHDFIEKNSLVSNDLSTKQKVNFTYRSLINKSTSYIDHTLVEIKHQHRFKTKIVEDITNASDHLVLICETTYVEKSSQKAIKEKMINNKIVTDEIFKSRVRVEIDQKLKTINSKYQLNTAEEIKS